MSLYNANTDIRASKCNYKTSNKLVLQLGTRDRLHLASTSFQAAGEKKSQNYLAYAVSVTHGLHLQSFETPCTAFTTVFYAG